MVPSADWNVCGYLGVELRGVIDVGHERCVGGALHELAGAGERAVLDARLRSFLRRIRWIDAIRNGRVDFVSGHIEAAGRQTAQIRKYFGSFAVTNLDEQRTTSLLTVGHL